MGIGPKQVMVIDQEKKSYYWTVTLCSGSGQVKVMEWLWLATVWVTYLLRYDTSALLESMIVKLQNFRVGCGGHN